MKTADWAITRMIYRHRRVLRRCLLGAVVAISLVIAFLLRFEFDIPEDKLPILLKGIALALAIKLPIFFMLQLDRGGWRYLEFSDLKAQFWGNLAASASFLAFCRILIGPGFPRSIYCIDFLLCFAITGIILFIICLRNEPQTISAGADAKGLLIYGAGVAGRNLLKDIQAHPSLGYRMLGFLDDDPSKRGTRFLGSAVIGSGREAAEIVSRFRERGKRIDEIVIAAPSANTRQMNEAIANCRTASVTCKTVPSLGELLTGRVLGTQIRDVTYTDLLGREPVRLDMGRVSASISGRSVLVTGGGGSIGSELCRQVVQFGPAKLVVFEQAETDLFRIHRELIETQRAVPVLPEIGTIRSYDRIYELLKEHRIDAIFHAAAYKHVPMMELHPLEAAENNVVGTFNLLEAALACRVASFVMISSDKAVNPTNVMGLTKRIAELLVASTPRFDEAGTRFVSVRFGNVLGSNGSVVPVFREQIATGGPVTVTHPEMRRYFMTIPEAVQLVLEAAPLGKGGEIFLLDMGEPVRILDLAKNMIRLSGRNPEEMEIRFVGLRPGEKLFEELHTTGENIIPTGHPKIKIFKGAAPTRHEMLAWMNRLRDLLADRHEIGAIAHMAAIVPEYTPSSRWKSELMKMHQAAGAN